ncbi:MAG: acylphosphatase [Pseudomonadota bacterium]
MPCLRLLISGRVQGVWFRESMRQEALKQGVSGWVRNLPDGRVEAVVCGEDGAVDRLLEWARRGPPMAQVTGVEAAEFTGENTFSSFEKR